MRCLYEEWQTTIQDAQGPKSRRGARMGNLQSVTIGS